MAFMTGIRPDRFDKLLDSAFDSCKSHGIEPRPAPTMSRLAANVPLMSDINDVPDVLRMRVPNLPGDIRVDKDVPINKIRPRK